MSGARVRRRARAAAAAAILAAALGGGAGAEPTGRVVRTRDALVAALRDARAGTRILVAPGIYDGGVHAQGVRGAAGRPVVVAAQDPASPPTFRGGANGFHLVDPEHVVLERLVFEGQTGNGLNLDDGGTPETPGRDVVLRGLVVRDVGPDGNRDGIKLSGLEDVRVEGSTVERWGRGGSAVDLVGCRRVTIEGNTFRHGPDADRANGVQAKGGSREVVVRRNRFEHAGARGVNAGGSTGLAFFRPPLAQWPPERFEAKDVRVEGNTFLGGQAAVAFVGVDGGSFRFNTVHVPGRWALRVLQETREPGFVPARNVEVSDNVVAFRSDRWSEGGVNVGPGTEPASFRFARNVWFCVDAPARTRDLVRLPTPERDGRHGIDPQFVDAEGGDLGLRPTSPARDAGADALPK